MNEINFEINDIEEISLSMDVGVKEIYPPIENLKITPIKEQQIFNHENSYGYDEVIVEPIPEEYIIPDGTLPITENTTYDVRRFAKVTASVHPTPNLQDKEATPTKDIQTIVADEEYDGLSIVEIKPIPENYIEPTGTIEIKTKGTHDVTKYANAEVDVLPTLQDKEITPTKESQTITSDEGYDGLNNVVVNPIPNNYIEPSGTKEITTNGTHNIREYENVNVNVPTPTLNLQNKSITITENGIQNIVADAGYDGLGNVAITTSVAGGSEPSNKNAAEIFYEGYKTLYEALDKSYNKTYDTTENITLYSPKSGYVNYFIIKVANGYDIFWSNSTYHIGYTTPNGSYVVFYPIRRLQIQSLYTHTTAGVKSSLKNLTDILKPETLSSSDYYYSTGYTTIEECINALQSSSTTYSKGTTTKYGARLYNNTQSCVVATNSIETTYKDDLINQCGRQISSNENIVAMA